MNISRIGRSQLGSLVRSDLGVYQRANNVGEHLWYLTLVDITRTARVYTPAGGGTFRYFPGDGTSSTGAGTSSLNVTGVKVWNETWDQSNVPSDGRMRGGTGPDWTGNVSWSIPSLSQFGSNQTTIRNNDIQWRSHTYFDSTPQANDQPSVFAGPDPVIYHNSVPPFSSGGFSIGRITSFSGSITMYTGNNGNPYDGNHDISSWQKDFNLFRTGNGYVEVIIGPGVIGNRAVWVTAAYEVRIEGTIRYQSLPFDVQPTIDIQYDLWNNAVAR